MCSQLTLDISVFYTPAEKIKSLRRVQRVPCQRVPLYSSRERIPPSPSTLKPTCSVKISTKILESFVRQIRYQNSCQDWDKWSRLWPHVIWSNTIWPTAVWLTNIWRADIWPTDIWKIGIWQTTILPTDICPTAFWLTDIWLTDILPTKIGPQPFGQQPFGQQTLG